MSSSWYAELAKLAGKADRKRKREGGRDQRERRSQAQRIGQDSTQPETWASKDCSNIQAS